MKGHICMNYNNNKLSKGQQMILVNNNNPKSICYKIKIEFRILKLKAFRWRIIY